MGEIVPNLIPRPLEILIVEGIADEAALVLKRIDRSRSGAAMRIRVLTDGDEALRILRDDAYRPDIILLELSQIKLGRKLLLQRLRENGANLNSIPIVGFSSAEMCLQDVLDSGVNAYITKPEACRFERIPHCD